MTLTRKMVADDAGPVATLMEEMRRSTDHPASVSWPTASCSIREMLECGFAVGHVLERDERITGAIFGLVTPDWLCGDGTASVMFWFTQAHELRGISLFRAFLMESKQRGAKRIFAASPLGPNYEQLNRIFQSSKMRPVETWWFKPIGKQ